METKPTSKVVIAFQEVIDTYGIGHVTTSTEIKDFIQRKYNINRDSIIPSDYCYNRVNDGITLSKPTFFEYLGHNNYRCLGENYPYTGDIYHKEQIVGVCQNGERKVFGITDKPAQPPKKKTQKSRDPSTRLRFEVLVRDQFTCRFCGASPAKDPSVTLHIDHIIPWSKGGETTLDNLQTLCSKCNLGKGNFE